MNHFILEGKEAVSVDVRTWGDWLETAKHQVAFTEIDGLEISTVFLGLDHGHGFTKKPLLFETMIKSRQREGIDAAKKAGKHLGRPHKIDNKFKQIVKEKLEISQSI